MINKKDGLHHNKQRYTSTRAYEYLVENYPDFKYAKTSIIKYFTKLKAFLYSFANMIDDIGIAEAVKKVNILL